MFLCRPFGNVCANDIIFLFYIFFKQYTVDDYLHRRAHTMICIWSVLPYINENLCALGIPLLSSRIACLYQNDLTERLGKGEKKEENMVGRCFTGLEILLTI